MGEFELRSLGRGDLDGVLELNNEAVPAVSGLDPLALEQLVGQCAAAVVADDGGDLAGFLLLLDGPGRGYASPNYAWFSQRYPSFLYVDRVVVAPTHQRRGLGRRFYEHAIGLADGVYPVLCAEVNTRPRNDTSLAFHEAFGFETVGGQDTEGGAKTVRMLARPIGGSGA